MHDSDGVERWLAVSGYEGYYEVSDRGRVRSVPRLQAIRNRWGGTTHRSVGGRVLNARSDGRYLQVSLCRNANQRTYRVHTLVATAFVGPCPPGHECLHVDGDATNNARWNLRWGTSTENAYDTVRHNHHHYRRRTHCRRGHPYEGRNLKISRNARYCYACLWVSWRSLDTEEERQALADWKFNELMNAENAA